jgi:hypothetical protein
LDYCPSLVTVIHTNVKELHLAHFSVKEYLLPQDLELLATKLPVSDAPPAPGENGLIRVVPHEVVEDNAAVVISGVKRRGNNHLTPAMR